jgi:DNA-damage-inducible protein J
MIASTRISVNIDEDVKQNAQKLFGEMGLDMTTAIDLFLRTVLIEKRLPFEVRTEQAYREAVHRAYISTELDKSRLEAADPNTKWLSQDEMKARLAKRREARSRV